jgi:hypothetical protein
VLKNVTQRLNADWRSVYRSFCIITWSARARGDVLLANRYEELCKISNSQFPDSLLSGNVSLFHSFIMPGDLLQE